MIIDGYSDIVCSFVHLLLLVFAFYVIFLQRLCMIQKNSIILCRTVLARSFFVIPIIAIIVFYNQKHLIEQFYVYGLLIIGFAAASNDSPDDTKDRPVFPIELLMRECPLKVFFKGKDLTYLMVSELFALDFDLTPEECVGKTDCDLYPPELAEKYRSDDRRILTNKNEEEYVEEYVFHGSLRLVKTVKKVICDADGTVLGILGHFTDITEQQALEESLKERERQLSTLLSNMPGMAYRCSNDKEWTMQYISEGSLALTGYTPSELLLNSRLSYNDVIYPDDRDFVWEFIQVHLNRAEPYKLEYRIQTVSGEIKWVLEHGCPIYDDAKQLIALEGFITDITSMKDIEDRLRNSERTLLAIIQTVPVGICLLNRNTIKWINGRFTEITGFHAEELIEDDLSRLFGSDNQYKKITNKLFTMLQKQEIVEIETTCRKKDGDTINIMICAALLAPNGLNAEMILSVVNVTDKIRMAAEREKLIDELEAKNTELERFAYTVSHDLKSPLISIEGFVKILKRHVSQILTDDDEFYDILRRITGASKKMRTLMDGLLELSRIGRVATTNETVNLLELVNEALELVSGRINEHNIAVTIDKALPNVLCDRERILLVLINLIDNAAKAVSNIDAPSIAIGACSPNGEKMFFIRDNGIGIESQHIERIFGLFKKLNPDTEGTGIGLTLVKRIIEIHGGKIRIESDGVGRGTTVLFSLPTS